MLAPMLVHTVSCNFCQVPPSWLNVLMSAPMIYINRLGTYGYVLGTWLIYSAVWTAIGSWRQQRIMPVFIAWWSGCQPKAWKLIAGLSLSLTQKPAIT